MKRSWVEQDGREEREWGRGMVILIKICINMSKEKILHLHLRCISATEGHFEILIYHNTYLFLPTFLI